MYENSEILTNHLCKSDDSGGRLNHMVPKFFHSGSSLTTATFGKCLCHKPIKIYTFLCSNTDKLSTFSLFLCSFWLESISQHNFHSIERGSSIFQYTFSLANHDCFNEGNISPVTWYNAENECRWWPVSHASYWRKRMHPR